MTWTQGDASPETRPLPWPFRVRPHSLLIGIGSWIAVAWLLFVAVDLLNVGGLGDALFRPMWQHLFNDRPVEWTQWLVLPAAILTAGYLAGWLAGMPQQGAATFFLLLGAGLGVMLFEDAGDARHVISAYVRDHVGEEVAGLPYRFVSDLPYFAVIAALPLYAVLRYGRHAWAAPTARRYLVAAVGLYALAGTASAFRHFRDLYITLGSRIDAWLFGGRFPPAPGMSQERAHFFVIDGPVEESVELLAATCMLGLVLAYARDVRTGAVPLEGSD